ncbi:MAG: hypothetical protein IPG58_06320 [Acidobacteria bacterium]|nr:hypothetical protein [Acidobacteriota bacterium]
MENETDTNSWIKTNWKYIVIGLIIFGSLAVILLQKPLAQNQFYHAFADSRPFLSVPNFGDVASNLAFLIVGVAGLWLCMRKDLGSLRNAWVVMFAGIALVGIASSYYHWTPNDRTLVWDRMTLTVGFMGLFVALLGEYITERFRFLLVPAVILGVFSVLYWSWFDDLRLYIWVQMVPLLIVPFVMLLFPAKFSHQWLIFVGALLYGSAKLTELGDKVIFATTQGIVSGHTLKHLLAAAGCWAIFLALKKRHPILNLLPN